MSTLSVNRVFLFVLLMLNPHLSYGEGDDNFPWTGGMKSFDEYELKFATSLFTSEGNPQVVEMGTRNGKPIVVFSTSRTGKSMDIQLEILNMIELQEPMPSYRYEYEKCSTPEYSASDLSDRVIGIVLPLQQEKIWIPTQAWHVSLTSRTVMPVDADRVRCFNEEYSES